MDWNKLPLHCYIDKTKKFVSFIPEKNIVLAKYNYKIWSKKFPQDMGDVPLKKLMLTNIGIYSIATPSISNSLLDLINMLCSKFNLKSKSLTITETNGGLGGFSIRLAKNFQNLNIVEINNEHVKIIKNNLKVYNLENENITIYNDDYLSLAHELKSDIIVCDPPWGGIEYSKQKRIELGFNNINVICVINELLRKNLFKIFILMTPKNYNISHLIEHVITRDIFIYKLNKHYFVAILNTD